MRSSVAAACCIVTALGACKPSGQKTTLGPFNAERFEEKTAAGERLDCFLLARESNKPARLCGTGQPTPGFTGFFFNAESPAPGSRFASTVGEPVSPGWYIVRPNGTSIDLWPLGRLPVREWLGGGKALLGVEVGTDHHTRVRVIDPIGRGERAFDVGQTRGDAFILVRAPDDGALLLVQKLGGDELILVRDPLGNPEVAVADASDEKSPGNRKFHARGDLQRRNGGQFIPALADLAAISWKDGSPLFEGAPMGPFQLVH